MPELADIPSASPIIQGPQAVTTVEKAHTAIGVPQTAFAPGAVDPLPTDERALDRIAVAVEHQESGGNEKAVSPKGAKFGQGPMGVSSAVAADFKGDARDPDQNRAIGRAQLTKLYHEFGNWPDTLAAYNWGRNNVNKWIAGGRKGKVPQETQNYIDNVTRNAGLGGLAVVVGKREVTADELAAIPSSGDAPGTPDTMGPETDRPDYGLVTGAGVEADYEQAPSTPEVTGAFLTGARRSIQDLALGPVQATLEQIRPELAESMTKAINEHENQYDTMMAKYPVAAAMGRVVGGTAAIMGITGMLGPKVAATTVGATLMKVLPAAVRYGLAGGALGLTEFHRTDEDGLPRWMDAALDATMGGAGAAVGSALGWGSRFLASKNAFQGFTNLLQDSVGDLEKSTSKVMSAFLSNYRRVTTEKNELYTLTNQAGHEFPGFDPNELGTAIKDALEANRQAGVSTIVKTTASKVVDELGLREIAAREAGHAQQVDAHARAYRSWEQHNFTEGTPGPERNAVIRDAVERGQVPPPPTPPAPAEQQFVPADRYSAAQQAISLAGRNARTPQARFQLRQISKGLADVAGRAAEDHGMNSENFLRRAAEVNEFFKKNIAPIRDSFIGKRTAAEAEAEITPGEAFDRVRAALKANNSHLLAKLADALGPEARPEMARIAEWEMLQAVGKTKLTNGLPAISKYIKDREGTLRELLGRDRLEQLKGEANIAQQVMSHSLQQHRRLWQWGTRSALLVIGGEEVIEGLTQGSPARMARGVGLIATPFAVHATFKILGKLTALPYMLPILRKAARLRPGSPELDRAVRQIEMRLGLAGPIAQRATEGVIQDQAAAP
jgi:Transglycosylase SLT domain